MRRRISSYTTRCCASILACFELFRSRFGVSPLFLFACFDAPNRVSNERAEDFSTVPTAAVNYRSRNAKARAAGGTLTGKVCGASAAPMPRHRSASTDLRSTQAWRPVHQLSSTLSVCQELLHCAPVSGSRHHSSHLAPPRYRGAYEICPSLFVAMLRSSRIFQLDAYSS